jgi:hypothetical protein
MEEIINKVKKNPGFLMNKILMIRKKTSENILPNGPVDRFLFLTGLIFCAADIPLIFAPVSDAIVFAIATVAL